MVIRQNRISGWDGRANNDVTAKKRRDKTPANRTRYGKEVLATTKQGIIHSLSPIPYREPSAVCSCPLSETPCATCKIRGSAFTLNFSKSRSVCKEWRDSNA